MIILTIVASGKKTEQQKQPPPKNLHRTPTNNNHHHHHHHHTTTPPTTGTTASPAMGRLGSARSGQLKQRLMARLRLVGVVVVVVLLITPLRNLLMPACLWNRSWNDLSSIKLIKIHVFDLFFYIDRTPYSGSCDAIHRRLEAPLKKLRAEDMQAYSPEDFSKALDKIKWKFTPDELWKVEHFKPSLTVEEQQEMLYTTLVMVTALELHNVSYVMAEGTLMGLHRHGGFIPWDDDVDLMIRADQWSAAKRVLSCLPGFSLNMGRDFMWKFMWNKSKLWRYENFIRFPYIDIFPANEDSEHVWPLTIWMKRDLIWRTQDTYPVQRLPMEQYLVTAAKNPTQMLARHYGPGVMDVCASRIFQRREREPFAQTERVRVPCRFLHDLYPFVFLTKDPEDGLPLHVRKVGGKVLSTFKPGVNRLTTSSSLSSSSSLLLKSSSSSLANSRQQPVSVEGQLKKIP